MNIISSSRLGPSYVNEVNIIVFRSFPSPIYGLSIQCLKDRKGCRINYEEEKFWHRFFTLSKALVLIVWRCSQKSIRCSVTLVVSHKPWTTQKTAQYSWMIWNKSGCNKLCFQRMKGRKKNILQNWKKRSWRHMEKFSFSRHFIMHSRLWLKMHFDIIWIWVEKKVIN